MRSTPPRRLAFTLVELLVVIGMIALLIAILLPAVSLAHDQANKVKCAANIHQIYLALAIYAEHNQQWLPVPSLCGVPAEIHPGNDWMAFPLAADPANPGGSWTGNLDYDNGALWPLLADGAATRAAVFNCPSEIESVRPVYFGALLSAPRNFSYSFNYYMRQNPNTPTRLGIKIGMIRRPESKILVCEELWPNDATAKVVTMAFGTHGPILFTPDDQLGSRHTGQTANHGFADGHVESLCGSSLGFQTIGSPNPQAVSDPNRILNYFYLFEAQF